MYLCLQAPAMQELLQMSDRQLVDVSHTLNRYPDIDLKFVIGDQPSDKGPVPATADRNIQLRVELERTLEGDMRPADCPRCAARSTVCSAQGVRRTGHLGSTARRHL